MNRIDLIISSLKEASIIACKYSGKIDSIEKTEDNNQVLTAADLEIGAMLISKLKKYFPNDNIIDEETGVIDNHSEYTWTIDPIDGTSNFANGVPLYGIMIGLLKEDTPIAGGIALPAFSKIYSAQIGKGAFCNTKRIHLPEEKDLDKVLFSFNFDGERDNPTRTYETGKKIAEFALNTRNIRSSNSAFDLAMVAEGSYGGSIMSNGKIWDIVPILAIIKEAGGNASDLKGNELIFNNHLNRVSENMELVISSKYLHPRIIQILSR